MSQKTIPFGHCLYSILHILFSSIVNKITSCIQSIVFWSIKPLNLVYETQQLLNCTKQFLILQDSSWISSHKSRNVRKDIVYNGQHSTWEGSTLCIVSIIKLLWYHFDIICWVQAHTSVLPAFAPSLFIFIFQLLKYISCKGKNTSFYMT